MEFIRVYYSILMVLKIFYLKDPMILQNTSLEG